MRVYFPEYTEKREIKSILLGQFTDELLYFASDIIKLPSTNHKRASIQAMLAKY
jgi:hypothetical protein